MFKELLAITIVWTVVGQLICADWLFIDYNLNLTFSGRERALIDQTRWIDYTLLSIRSILCILISTVKNIHDSCHQGKMILIPPDASNLDKLEMLFNFEVAIDHFYTYLENMIRIRETYIMDLRDTLNSQEGVTLRKT